MKRERVLSEREQDRWLQRLLRRRSAGRAVPAGPDACLDPQTLAAWSDGTLKGQELAAAEMHASNCSRCLASLAAMERTSPVVTGDSRSGWLSFKWLVPMAAAATAVAIWVAIPEQQTTPVVREAAQKVAPMPLPETMPLPAPSGAPAEPEASTRQIPSASVDTLTAQARDESVAPPAPPAPRASADLFADSPAATAQRRDLSRAAVIEAISPDPLVIWRVLSGTTIERSTDAGKTWIKTANPPAPISPIVAVTAVDALRASVTTADGRTFSTADGGATWTPVQENRPAPF